MLGGKGIDKNVIVEGGGGASKCTRSVCGFIMLKTAIPTNCVALPTCATDLLNMCGKDYISGVVKVVKLILVMPATNLTSERSLRG